MKRIALIAVLVILLAGLVLIRAKIEINPTGMPTSQLGILPDELKSIKVGKKKKISKKQIQKLMKLADKEIVTESGLKYGDIKAGNGDNPKINEQLLVNYICWLENGEEFDNTYRQKMPVPVNLNNAKPGLKEGLLTMKIGGSRWMIIPPELAYGEKGTENIPPDSNLIYYINLIAVMPSQGPPIPQMENLPPPIMPDALKALNIGETDKISKSQKQKLMQLADKEVVTESGLKYGDIIVGKGNAPKPTDEVVVNYIGWLENGKEFDNSFRRGQSAKFQLSGLISGWKEGLLTMKPGGSRWMIIPPNLGYGSKGAGSGKIPPNSTLIFYIQLESIASSTKSQVPPELMMPGRGMPGNIPPPSSTIEPHAGDKHDH